MGATTSIRDPNEKCAVGERLVWGDYLFDQEKLPDPLPDKLYIKCEVHSVKDKTVPIDGVIEVPIKAWKNSLLILSGNEKDGYSLVFDQFDPKFDFWGGRAYIKSMF